MNQRVEMERVEARILLEDLLEAWKHTRMFPAGQGSLMIKKRQAFFWQNTNQPWLFLKVHKIENFFGFDFEICTFSLLVMSKY